MACHFHGSDYSFVHRDLFYGCLTRIILVIRFLGGIYYSVVITFKRATTRSQTPDTDLIIEPSMGWGHRAKGWGVRRSYA